MATTRGSKDYPGAAEWVPSRPTLSNLRSAIQDCRGCDLYLHATQPVLGDGPGRARILLLGEQPGDKEDRAGLPFVGPAGRLLDQALGEAGIDPADTYRTNAVKHFRHEVVDGKRIHKSPVRWQVAACEPWLLAELALVRPQVVVLLGGTAGSAVFGSSFRVGTARGRRLEWPAGLGPVEPAPVAVATTHPAAVLRSRRREDDFAALVGDLVLARDLMA